ncbi:hypothetical protein H1R20_g6669, partial [Candolleomyces eurysporus]
MNGSTLNTEFIAKLVNVLLFGVSVPLPKGFFLTLQTVFSIHHSYGLFVLKFDQPNLLKQLIALGPVAYDSSKEKAQIFRSIATLMCIVAFAHFGTGLAQVTYL